LKQRVLDFFTPQVPVWDDISVYVRKGFDVRFRGTVAQAKKLLATKKKSQHPELRRAVEQARKKGRDHFVTAVNSVTINPTGFESTTKTMLGVVKKHVPYTTTKNGSQIPDLLNTYGIVKPTIKKPNVLYYNYAWRDVSIGRTDRLRYLLQFARDMRKIRETIETGKSPMGTPFKTAAKMSQEIQSITNQVVQANPDVPYQVAAGAASSLVQQTSSLTPGQETSVAQKIVSSAVANDPSIKPFVAPIAPSQALLSKASAGAVQLVAQGIPRDIAVKSAAYQVQTAENFNKWLLPVGAVIVASVGFLFWRKRRGGLTKPQNRIGLSMNPRRRTKRGG